MVLSTLHYVFSDGDKATSTIALRFRSEEEIRSSLSAAGFTVETIYGGWRREPVGHPDGELLAVVLSTLRHYVFSDGDKATSTIALRFRSEEEIRSSLSAAGFTVETIYGGWRRE